MLEEAILMLEQAVNAYEADDVDYQAVELYKKLCEILIEVKLCVRHLN